MIGFYDAIILYLYIYMYIYIYSRIYACLCMYACVCMCVCVCMSMFMYRQSGITALWMKHYDVIKWNIFRVAAPLWQLVWSACGCWWPDPIWRHDICNNRDDVSPVGITGVQRDEVKIVTRPNDQWWRQQLTRVNCSPYKMIECLIFFTMASRLGYAFRITGPLWGESTRNRPISLIRTIDAELSYFHLC